MTTDVFLMLAVFWLCRHMSLQRAVFPEALLLSLLPLYPLHILTVASDYRQASFFMIIGLSRPISSSIH